MARILVQATLPHSRPHKGPNPHEFERVNGRFTLYMNAPPSVGLPYGSYPRLVLAWFSTEAVRTRNREIELGPTFSSFMYKLGLTPITGKRGTTSRLRDQLHRLFPPRSGAATPTKPRGMPPESATPSPTGTSYGGRLGNPSSGLSGVSYLRKPYLIPWEALQTPFGAAYGRPRDFKRKFLGHLGEVQHLYPSARLAGQTTGLLLSPREARFSAPLRASAAP